MDKKRINFEPELDLTEDQNYDLENQVLDITKEKLGNDYLIWNWKLEIKCTVIAKLKNDQ